MKRVAIFASGSGTNAENIAKYFEHHLGIKIEIILSNRPQACVLKRADRLGIKASTFKNDDLQNPQGVLKVLLDHKIDLIVLAGFLLKVPHMIINQYPNKIINIHPALLPEFGGKGMYGNHVHEAVIKAGKPKSGITIHYVDEIYDNGKIIFQAECFLNENESPESLAEKIHHLEHKHFPVIIEKLLS